MNSDSHNNSDDICRELQLARTAAQNFLAQMPPMTVYANEAGIVQAEYNDIRSGFLDIIELSRIGLEETTRRRDRIRVRDAVVNSLEQLVGQVTLASLRVAPMPSAAIN